MRVFVTLYDKGYLSRGILLYRSLCRVCDGEFRLYVLAIDEKVVDFWKVSGKDNVFLISVRDLKNSYPELNSIEKQRTHAEFCWTCSPYCVQYVLNEFNESECTYLDSDIYFYNSPELLFKELKKESVMITEHNYTPRYDQSASSGKFCVQFMYFKNNNDGNRVLEWWRRQCEMSCTIDEEKGLCGDQKYLDDWESRFCGIVYNCGNIGCGVAPWNLQKYEIIQAEKEILLKERITGISAPIVFFHFHQLKEYGDHTWKMNAYPTSGDFKELIYRPYITELEKVQSHYGMEQVSYRKEYLTLVRSFPVPYLGVDSVEVSLNNDNRDDCIVLELNGDFREQISVRIMHKNGIWLQIKPVGSFKWIEKNYHEVIWKCQRLLMFSESKDDEEWIYSLYRLSLNKEWVMTELICDYNTAMKISHPFYNIKQVLRIYEDDSDTEYADVLNSEIISIGKGYHNE